MSRPVAVMIVAVSLWIAAFIALVVGIALLFQGTFLDKIWEYNLRASDALHSLGRGIGIVFLALSLAVGFAGNGLMRRRRWAWWIAIAIFATNGLGDLLSLIKTRDTVRVGPGIVIAAIFLVLLLNRRVRQYLN